MTTALTGGRGFLGWHVRSAVRAHSGDDCSLVPLGEAFDLDTAVSLVDGADHLIHLAGVNRAADDELVDLNILLAQQAAAAIRRAPSPPSQITFAGTTQAGNGTPYAIGKERASRILRSAAREVGANYVDIALPNLFGEHGRADYNSVVATFSHQIGLGKVPQIHEDRELSLLAAQTAADLLLGSRPAEELERLVVRRTVSDLLDRLTYFGGHYAAGRIPALVDRFDHDLFNAFRSVAHSGVPSFELASSADERGRFTELVRAAGSPGQTSFSTTEPGVTRGQHFHRRKIERFAVVGGSARISLRRLFTSDVVSIDVDGAHPVAVDMPTLWSHSITNTGSTPLSTVFWCADTFDPTNPDTYPEPV